MDPHNVPDLSAEIIDGPSPDALFEAPEDARGSELTFTLKCDATGKVYQVTGIVNSMKIEGKSWTIEGSLTAPIPGGKHERPKFKAWYDPTPPSGWLSTN